MKIKTLWNTTIDETGLWPTWKIGLWLLGHFVIMAAIIVVPIVLTLGI